MEDREPTPKEVQTEEEKKVPLRKSRRRIFLKALLWILGVILLLPAAVYIPFVQDFLKDTACSIIEKSTGMKVEIGKFRLRFPLKVSLQDLLVTPHPGDTMAQAKEALVDVRMLPLLHLDVQVEKLQLTDGAYRMVSPDSSMILKVRAGSLTLPAGSRVNIAKSEISLADVSLSHGSVDLYMNVWKKKPSPPDTASSTPFLIRLDRLDLEDFRFGMSMLPTIDTLDITASRGLIADAEINLRTSRITARKLQLEKGDAKYITPTAEYIASHPAPPPLPSTSPPMVIEGDSVILRDFNALYAVKDARPKSGFDPSYIKVSGISLAISKFYNESSTIRLPIASLKAKERCGLEISEASGTLGIDSLGLTLDKFFLRTPFSKADVTADLSFGAMAMNPSAPLSLDADLRIGHPDIRSFMPSLGKWLRMLPSGQAIKARAEASGSLSSLRIPKLDLEVPALLRLAARGYVDNPMEFRKMKGSLSFDGTLGNTKPILSLAGLRDIVVPPLSIKGKAGIAAQRITADLAVNSSAGDLAAKGFLSLTAESYNAHLTTNDLDVDRFMPSLGIGGLTATLDAEGAGFNPLRPHASTHVDLRLDRMRYRAEMLENIALRADLQDGAFDIDLDSRAANFDASVKGSGTIGNGDYTFDLVADLVNVDLKALGFSPTPNGGSAMFTLKGSATPESGIYDAWLTADNIYWLLNTDVINLPQGITAHLDTGKDFVRLMAEAAGLHLDFNAQEGFDNLMTGFSATSAIISKQLAEKRLDVDSLRSRLPAFSLDLNADGKGLMGKVLDIYGLSADTLFVNVDNSASLKGNAGIYNFSSGNTRLDTITLGLSQRGSLLDYRTHIGNGPGQMEEFASVDLNGYVGGNRASLFLLQKNLKGETGYRLGLTAAMMDSTISLHFTPLNATIAYLPWKLNDDNFIEYDLKNRIDANLLAESSDSRLLLRTEDNGKGEQELHVNLDNIRIQDFINMIADAPPVTGSINSDMRVRYNNGVFIGKGNIALDNLYYDKMRVGNIGADFKAGLNTDGNTGFSAAFTVDKEKAMTLRGVVRTDSAGADPTLQGSLVIDRLPLDIINPFIGKETASLSGALKGEMKVRGAISQPILNGQMRCDSAAVYIPMIGSSLRLNSNPVTVVDNFVTFSDFNIYGANANPLGINGTVDLGKFISPQLDLRAAASDFMLIDNKRNSRGDLYGKLLLNLDASAKGKLDMLDINAALSILNGTDVTYAIPAAVSQLQKTTQQSVVKFVQFSDTAAIARKDTVARSSVNMRVNASLNISNGVQATVLLSSNGTDKVQLTPSGSLNYFQNYMGDMRLNGQLNLGTGFARYSVPVIGEKMFAFEPDCYVLWNGQLMNPVLHLSAVDKHKSVIKNETGSSRLVNFLISLNVSGTLSQPKVVFDLSTDDDITIQNELSGMSADQRSAQAMNMLVTGQYSAGGSKSAAGSAENALYSFLESQINSWAANNIRGVDLSFGIDQYEQTVNGRNSSTMSYSYQVSKSLFDNRFKIIVGGNYSTDASADENFAENLISDISFEYMLRQTNTMSMYLKLFRHAGFESVLEGEVTEMGVGFVMRRKIGSINRLFRWMIPKKYRQRNKEASGFKKVDIPSDTIQNREK